LRMAYLSYPYTDNPEKRTEEARQLAEEIVSLHPDIVLIVPHIAFDQLLQSFIRDGTWWRFICDWEYEAISRCDFFILGCELNPKTSVGMIWEWSFAKRLGKEIVSMEEFLNGED